MHICEHTNTHTHMHLQTHKCAQSYINKYAAPTPQNINSKAMVTFQFEETMLEATSFFHSNLSVEPQVNDYPLILTDQAALPWEEDLL